MVQQKHPTPDYITFAEGWQDTGKLCFFGAQSFGTCPFQEFTMGKIGKIRAFYSPFFLMRLAIWG